uniref:Rho-GAP domain-containing protein n=1 Tax=Arcella intermedia TaxID=1963864 RepID=A0A6B2L8D2_9EUKA
MSFNSNEQVRIDVYDKGYHLLGYYEKIISDLVPFPISERFITRKLLQAKKATKTSSIILDISFEEGNPVKHFGRPLEESLAQSQVDKVLHITDMATIYIRKYIKTEGLFRLSGNSTRITELKTLLDKGIEVDLSVESIHDICSLYKLYFSELPDKLFPESLYSSYKKSAKSEETEKLQETSQLISKLPPENQSVFIDLISTLNEISSFSSINNMTANNLAICFAPTIILPASVYNDPQAILSDTHVTTDYLRYIIENSSLLFPTKPYSICPPVGFPPFSDEDIVESRAEMLKADFEARKLGRNSNGPVASEEINHYRTPTKSMRHRSVGSWSSDRIIRKDNRGGISFGPSVGKEDEE